MRIILAISALLISSSAWANVPSATPLYNQYTCNSSTTQFPYGFPITASSDMTVYLTDTSGTTTQLSSSVFSVDTTNLWVNYPLVGSPCITNYILTLRPSTPQTQTTTYGGRAPFTATAVGSSFDKLTLISQQLQSQINRTFLQPANVTTQVTFPSASAGSLIGWDGTGTLANINNPAAVAQWSLSGANISYNTGNVSTTNTFSAGSILSTGNVGINSTTPGQKLDVVGTVRATAFSGPLTGNVIGNLTGNVTGNASGTAATVTTAAQPSITSVGTLTSLIVSGNVGMGTAVAPTALYVNGVISSNTGITAPFLGAKVAKNIATTYQALTDGFVNASCTSDGGGNLTMQLKTDAATPPTTVVCDSRNNNVVNTSGAACFAAVKKGDYYLTTTANCTTSPVMYFTPLGT